MKSYLGGTQVNENASFLIDPPSVFVTFLLGVLSPLITEVIMHSLSRKNVKYINPVATVGGVCIC